VTLIGPISQIAPSANVSAAVVESAHTVNVPVTINYTSLDSSTLNLELTAPAPPPSVAINTLPVSIASTQLTIVNPKPGFPKQSLNPFRTKTVPMPISIGPGGSVITQIRISCPDFPQLDPPPISLDFDLGIKG
jgi:hypothetical protein